jgi:hypothetical protein
VCQTFLKRSHILWRKQLIGLTGRQVVTNWAYCCPNPSCPGLRQVYASHEAETLHLKHRRYSRELIVHLGYRRFWQHQTIYELHAWLTEDLNLPVSLRQVPNLLTDFLALLRAAQPAKIRQTLKGLKMVVIGVDGMQPEKGNNCLYVVRELQTGLTLLAEHLEESSQLNLSQHIFEPLKQVVAQMGLEWRGVVTDAQASLRLAVAESLPEVPHQVCQFHCLREAGDWTFQTDRKVKKQLKTALRQRLSTFQRRLSRLPATNPYRAVLVGYAEAIRTALLINGIAPFDLGGLNLFTALTDLASSLAKCQKKGITPACVGY